MAAPDGRAFYVSIAHGRPNGLLLKYDVASGRLLAQVELGMFPATVDISPSGALVWVINFNFEDPEMRSSSVSVVDGGSMTEVARAPTCRMPHGSRLNPAGTLHYSGCMMNDLLVEVDARAFRVSRLLDLTAGREGAVDASLVAAGDEASGEGAALSAPAGAPSAHGGHAGHGDAGALPMRSACSPTWAQPSADGAKVYVACNKSNEIVEVDAGSWRATRRWTTPKAPYNLAVTPDGSRLVATQKGPGTVTVWRLADAALLAEIPGTRTVASGIIVSADSRYAFATLEGVGGEPGTVDIIDLQALAKVASVNVGKQAGGIALLP
jgi:DNA-binding beta-propeller fold protein YncE